MTDRRLHPVRVSRVPSEITGYAATWLQQLADEVNATRRSVIGVYSAGSSIPNVEGVGYLYVANASGVTITNFANGIEGQVLTLVFADSNTSVSRANAALAGGANFVSSASDTLTLVKGPGPWLEIGRAANS